MKKRKLAVIVGSKSDLESGQCTEGLRFLQEKAGVETINVVGVFVSSIHRNTEATLRLLKRLAAQRVDAIITGAGWANHLTGIADAYLRYGLNNTETAVIGVAFGKAGKPTTQTAVASIAHTPGTQAVFDSYVGAPGFLRACKFAVDGELPDLKKPEPRQTERLTLAEALAVCAA